MLEWVQWATALIQEWFERAVILIDPIARRVTPMHVVVVLAVVLCACWALNPRNRAGDRMAGALLTIISGATLWVMFR